MLPCSATLSSKYNSPTLPSAVRLNFNEPLLEAPLRGGEPEDYLKWYCQVVHVMPHYLRFQE